MSNRRILVIDDDKSVREVVRHALKDRYDVTTARGALEAFKYMSKNPVALVLLDIKMPKMDGITTLKEIKKRHPETEVIMLTAYATFEQNKTALKLGAFAVIMKPFDINNLHDIVDRALNKEEDK